MISRRSFARLLSVVAAAAPLAAPAARAATPLRIVKPKRLSAGDTLGLVLPASAEYTPDEVMLSKEQLELLGFKVVLGEHAFDRHGYFAGTDRDRAADVNRMFADDRIAGIFCYTGGWGSPRILPLLDYDLIARKPKVLIGYSDITAMLNAIFQRTGLVTFHGPVGSSVFDLYTQENFRRVVMTPEPAGLLAQPSKKPDALIDRVNRVVRISPGKATGRLAGGNLTMLASLMGTPYEIDTRGAILFLEDIREDIYRIDRMLTQLALGGKLDAAAGVAFGRCTECGTGRGSGFSLEDVLRDRLGSLRKPVLSGLSFGHIEQKLTLPVGVSATLDGDVGTLTLNETAVT